MSYWIRHSTADKIQLQTHRCMHVTLRHRWMHITFNCREKCLCTWHSDTHMCTWHSDTHMCTWHSDTHMTCIVNASDIQLPRKFLGMYRHFNIIDPWMIFFLDDILYSKRPAKKIGLNNMDRYVKFNCNQREIAVNCRAFFLETARIFPTLYLHPTLRRVCGNLSPLSVKEPLNIGEIWMVSRKEARQLTSFLETIQISTYPSNVGSTAIYLVDLVVTFREFLALLRYLAGKRSTCLFYRALLEKTLTSHIWGVGR